MRASDHGPFPRRTVTAFRLIATLALPCTVTTCTPASAEGAAFAELASALEAVPGIAPRLSIGNAFRPCVERPSSGGTILRADCPARRQARAERLASIARRAHGGDDDPHAARTLAIIDLFADDERGRALDRSITALRRLATLADHPAPVLADLAAALIVRAERTQSPRDLLEAYETTEQALRHDARNPAALYNRALALERFGLVDETAKDWRAYLAVDARSRWADDARRRLDALEHLPGPPAPPAADAPLSAYTAYAAADPQGARELGMDRLLGEWGAAIEAGDTARAADRLARATALGEALARRPGGDASLADAVGVIRLARANPEALHTLASAHRGYAAGRAAFEALDYAGADATLAAAEAESSSALVGWSRLYRAVALIQLGRDEWRQALARAAAADASRHAALVARAQWLEAQMVARSEGWERSLHLARFSARAFARAGERENEGAALLTTAEAHFLFDEPDSAYAATHRALDRLRPYRASVRLHNLLLMAADEAADDGLLRPALRMQDEGVAIAGRNPGPVAVSEALLARAQLLASAGAERQARADLQAVRGRLGSIQDGGAREWLRTEVLRAEALVARTDDPGGATEALDSAAAFFTRSSRPFLTLRALVQSAEARLLAGDAAGAARRLESAVALLDRRRDSLGVEPRRAAVFDKAREVIDRLVLLKLAEGKTTEALKYMDQGRASLAAAGRVANLGGEEVRGPAGEVVVEYARIADTLLAWTVAGESVQVSRTVLDTLQFARTLATLEERLQDRAGDAEVRSALSTLYEWLVRPVEARLGRAETPVVIIADGEIAAVPFPALFDARRGRYLLQDHPLRFAVSLREARRPPPRPAVGGVLLVADPAFDRREHPLLEPLPHARAEVRAIAPDYANPTVLEGRMATRAALESALARSTVVHFAGHAVFDDERPERSHLVLGAAGRSGAGRITAAELAALDLRHVRVVVLSACRTVRGGRNRAGGYTGLAGSLLAAGAGGIVASTWDVDDRATAALMAEFHHSFAGDATGPAALRRAQLALLHSRDSGLRSPAAWAAFRYAGR